MRELSFFRKIIGLVLLVLISFINDSLQAQQLDATFSVEPGASGNYRLKMVLNQSATFQFSESYASTQNAFSVIIKNVYNATPSPGGFATASGLGYTTSGGKSGNGTSMGTYGITFGPFIHTTDEVVVFSLAANTTINSGETLTIPVGTVIQASPGNYGAAQTFNAGPYTAVIANGAFTGIAATMITSASAPTLTSANATSITATTAVLGGNITDNGGAFVTERGIVWSTSTNPTTADNQITNGSGSGPFSATIGSLPPATTIFYRAYAINSQGTAYGSNISFSTLPNTATIAATVFLEGAYNGTNLSKGINADIPTNQPYTINGHTGGSTGSVPSDAVDWVLVELREAASASAALNSTKIGSAAGFLMTDGSIKSTDGTSNLTVSLTGNTGSEFFIVIYHRNHLPIMSSASISESSGSYSIDFTSSAANTYQNTTALVSLSGSKFGMVAGDTDGDGDIDTDDLATWQSNNGVTFNYSSNGVVDFNLDGEINAVDRNDFQQKNTSKTRQVPSN
ncbi:hypothetical protein [Roseivirga misakiensis]|uniref:EF-hand domain-containing protein n=1 Tax=Roseivirga misakiensis TaxID=1563681 RepID=A0A1E5T747_9BACT|nr:hypothetical protein [Roseivirga misakiensis]OEK07190.1 hypothetical protein BFP71_05930 [Roseivirga misakiensis]